MALVSHPGSHLIHAASGSHLPREITSHFNRTHVSNSLPNPILTQIRTHTYTHTHSKTSQLDSYLHIVTSVFGVKRHLTSLSVTHIQRRAEGENSVCVRMQSVLLNGSPTSHHCGLSLFRGFGCASVGTLKSFVVLIINDVKLLGWNWWFSLEFIQCKNV